MYKLHPLTRAKTMAYFISLFLLMVLSSCSRASVVHVVAHSHCDPGYRKTFEDYFTEEVKSILDTVVEV